MQPTPSASQFRAIRPRVIAFISRTMKPICDVVYTLPACCSSCIAPSFLSLSLALFTTLRISLSLLLSLSLSYLTSRQETAFLASTTGCLCLSLFGARCIGMRILSRAASHGRFDLRGCAYNVKSKSRFVFSVCDWLPPTCLENACSSNEIDIAVDIAYSSRPSLVFFPRLFVISIFRALE